MRFGTSANVPVRRKPITGRFDCARAATGQVAIAPPSRLTNSRRLMPGMGSLPGAAGDHSRWEPPGAGSLTHQEPAGGWRLGPWDGPDLLCIWVAAARSHRAILMADIGSSIS